MSPVSAYNPGRCTAVCPLRIGKDGMFQQGPALWTAGRVSAGTYEIVHNAGHTNYGVIAGVINAPGIYKETVTVTETNENRILVQTTDSTQPSDADLWLLVVMP